MSTYKEAMVAPTNQLSFLKAVYEMFQGRYTYLGVHQKPVIATIKSELTKSIADTELRLTAQKKVLTAELNLANQILQSIPSQLSQIEKIYSAVTGYNTQ